ncbi:type II toxin-antitoxin system HipA family toxin [Collimonas humicola]|uniref:type II toxin-antitoxin system HipA family toxin n=1 Tax=Collimonas humicola TaxID=2825886 RepID=UPI002E7710E9|nr:type II toxin-antitoxin system HipA family toxin [Collimonas humicola]
MNGELVGRWMLKGNGASEFSYHETWLNSPRKRPISLSMPLRPASKPYRDQTVNDFFDNLLPDTRKIRERIQSRFHAASVKAFDLLEQIGRDCVGALQLLPEDTAPADIRRIQGAPMSEEDIEQLLEECLTPNSQQDDGQDDSEFRISLAGAQEKTALLKLDGKWMHPQGPTPTTHILKLPIGVANRGIDLTTSVENEWLCSRIMAAFGIQVAESHIRHFGARQVLEVERFDREFSDDGSWIIRLPQEDFCQVTGTPGSLKYESEGGPGIIRIMELLLGSVTANEDRLNFMRTQILFWLLCAIDGHAKNFSVFLLPEGRFRLTPSYDVLSAYPVLGNSKHQLSPKKVKMAMAIQGKNRHYAWSEFRRRHWISTAQACGLETRIDDIIDKILAQLPHALDEAMAQIPPGFPDRVADSIFKGIRASAEQLAQH